ncbi:DUF6161 domain-containing protein [Pseudomonas sp. NPDC089734]|uniref:DUF6161 domain-containing protein n=1 Tax=Pseudomonas sp. NPDC089734 TaxID=3364469 RepID=UPI00380D7A50
MVDSVDVSLQVNDDVPRRFSVSTCEKWIQDETQAWGWLRNVERNISGFTRELYRALFHAPLSELKTTLAANNEKSIILKIGRDALPYVSSTSADGILINNVREHYGPIVAAIALVYLHPQNRTAFNNSNYLLQEIDSYPYEKSLGIHIAIQNQTTYEFTRQSHMDRLHSLSEEFESRSQEVKRAIEFEATNVEIDAMAMKDKVHKDSIKLKSTLRRRAASYKRYARRAAALADKEFQDAKRDLTSARDAFNLKIDLDTSVSYWENRKTSHTKQKRWWLGIATSLMLLMFLGAIFFLDIKESKHDLPQNATAAKVDTAEKAEIKAAIIPAEPNGTTAIVSAIAELTKAALLITLIGVGIRIALRQFNTHSQLALEAEERITFTKTYLALLNEGKLKDEADRKLVLESLFKPSQAIAGPEVGFSTPIELILKTIGDRRPT